MLGDMFDFWWEFEHVVPKGFTRFLGKVSELTDLGIEVHFFVGNHDMWCKRYFEEECGVIMHFGSATIDIGDKTFFIDHGDGLGDPDPMFRFLRKLFHNRLLRRLFSFLPTSISVPIGFGWAAHSMRKHKSSGEAPFKGENKEPLVIFAKSYLNQHPDVNFFMFGHRHIQLEHPLSETSRMYILGDWITSCTFAVWDGVNMRFDNYIEGETDV